MTFCQNIASYFFMLLDLTTTLQTNSDNDDFFKKDQGKKINKMSLQFPKF